MEKSETIFPNYQHSVLNLINSILKYYGVETEYEGLTFMQEIFQKKYKNIVLILLDGMGDNVLKIASPDGFLQKHKKDVITSVCPSTTAAAMTTYYSGKPPIATGWIAMSQYFKEIGRAIDLFREIDSHTRQTIKESKINIMDLVSYESIYAQIEKVCPDVKAYEINPKFCTVRSKRSLNADTTEQMCEQILALCKNTDQNFILGYQDNPDSLLHKFGCHSKEVKDMVKNAEFAIEKMCKQLEGTNTLVMVSADHGHQDIEKIYSVLELEEIQDCILMPPAFESRAVTFWIKKDKKEKFEKYFKEKFKEEFLLFTKEEFLRNKFLGEGKQHEKVDDFMGDYVAIAIGKSIIKLETNLSKPKIDKKATHCGFTKNEMEVPVILIDCK